MARTWKEQRKYDMQNDKLDRITAFKVKGFSGLGRDRNSDSYVADGREAKAASRVPSFDEE